MTHDSIGHLKTLCTGVLSLNSGVESEWKGCSSPLSIEKMLAFYYEFSFIVSYVCIQLISVRLECCGLAVKILLGSRVVVKSYFQTAIVLIFKITNCGKEIESNLRVDNWMVFYPIGHSVLLP